MENLKAFEKSNNIFDLWFSAQTIQRGALTNYQNRISEKIQTFEKYLS